MIKTSTNAFIGEHCESTATGTLLNHLGIQLSEAMIFGLGQGLGFIIWDMKCLNLPFIGGRIRQELPTRNLCRNLGLRLDIKERHTPLSTRGLTTSWGIHTRSRPMKSRKPVLK